MKNYFLRKEMKKKSFAGIWIFASFLLLFGCEAPSQAPESVTQKPPVTEQEKTPPPAVPVSSSPLKEIQLTANEFSGEIFISSENIKRTEGGFEIPVYLKNVNREDIVDTVGLKSILPEGARLEEVRTPSNYTAELDFSQANAPVVYYHPFSITASSYEPVVASDQPIFTLVYSGDLKEPISFEGSFFQTSGVLIRTNRQTLAP